MGRTYWNPPRASFIIEVILLRPIWTFTADHRNVHEPVACRKWLREINGKRVPPRSFLLFRKCVYIFRSGSSRTTRPRKLWYKYFPRSSAKSWRLLAMRRQMANAVIFVVDYCSCSSVSLASGASRNFLACIPPPPPSRGVDIYAAYTVSRKSRRINSARASFSPYLLATSNLFHVY